MKIKTNRNSGLDKVLKLTNLHPGPDYTHNLEMSQVVHELSYLTAQKTNPWYWHVCSKYYNVNTLFKNGHILRTLWETHNTAFENTQF